MSTNGQGHRSALPVIPAERLGEAFRFLAAIPTPEVPVTKQKPAEAFPACSPPEMSTPPHFTLPYRRALLTAPIPTSFSAPGDPDISGPAYPRLGCVYIVVEEPAVYFSHDHRFEQTWNLIQQEIGDLASTMSLAPSEQLTLEFLNTQRKVLDQTMLDSTEELTSTESTTIDKSVVDVARSSTKTEKWHVDGGGRLSLGSWLGINISGGGEGSETQSAQNTVQHITEATKKSAHSLKVLHKIEVRGVTEEFIQNRMTRVIKNPYPDRALSINVFQLIKHFSVQTALTEIRPSLIIEVNHFFFDVVDDPDLPQHPYEEGKAFVIANAEFLRESLIDQSLIDELPTAIQAAKPVPPTGALQDAQDIAKLALEYLYTNKVVIFDVPDINIAPSPLSVTVDADIPATSFGAQAPHNALDETLKVGGNTAIVFTILNYFYTYYDSIHNPDNPHYDKTALDKHAITLVTTLANNTSKLWTDASDPSAQSEQIRALFDKNDFTEVFRRLPGFLAMVSGMLQPLLTAAEEEKKAQANQAAASFALKRLLAHLKCHENYYIQQFLPYAAHKTSNQTIVDFVNQTIEGMPSDVSSSIYQAYDIQHSFVDGQTIVVPNFQALEGNQITHVNEILSGASTSQVFSYDQIKPTVEEIEVPADGIHLEVAGGACVLKDLPAQVENSIEFSIHNASLSAHVSSGGISPTGTRKYIVQPRDTLSAIAQHFNTTVDELVRLNNIPNPDVIRAGQVLLITA